MSRAHNRIVEFLDAAEEPASVAVIATVLNLGRSTVSKHLQSLEAEGRAVRTPGTREGRAKAPDLWNAPTPAPAPDEADNEESTEPQEAPGDAAPERAEAEAACSAPEPGAAPEPDSPRPGAADGGAGQAADMPRPSERLRAAPRAAAKPSAPATHEAGWNPISRTRRLEPGELRRMVKAVLEGAPDEEFSPTEIGHLLGRSIGAIQNCLARLANDGEAELTSDAPRRYSAA